MKYFSSNSITKRLLTGWEKFGSHNRNLSFLSCDRNEPVNSE